MTAAPRRDALIPAQPETGTEARPKFRERRRSPRPLLAEIRRGAEFNLLPPTVVTGAARIAEFLIVAVLGFAIYLVYVEREGPETHLIYLAVVLGAATANSLLLQAFDLYQVSALRNFVGSFARIALAWALVVAGLMALAFFVKMGAEFSRVWIAIWYVSVFSVLFAERFGLSVLAKRWTKEGRLNRRAVIVGGGPEAEELIEALEASADTDIRIAGIFDDRGPHRVSPVVAGYPKLGNINELVAFARGSRIDVIIVSLPQAAESRLLQLLQKLWVLPADIKLSAHNNRLRFRPRTYSVYRQCPLHRSRRQADRQLGLCAQVDVRQDYGADRRHLARTGDGAHCRRYQARLKGPVLFRQNRQGFNNELIEVLKFRSMYVDRSDADAARLVTKDDDRVTRVGRFLRKTSLDELPQFLNVLKGDLSLVGPRPHALKAKAEDKLYHDVVDGYFARHRVKPGVTGWAQVNGWRGETDTEEKIQRRVEHDLYYIENWSVTLDLYILLLTPFALFKTQNAY